jgi:hypothetical protein
VSFIGFVGLDTTLTGIMLSKDDGNLKDADSLPTYRIYGPGGLTTGGTGAASFLDTGVITSVSNATPIVITSASHNLQNGLKVTITGTGLSIDNTAFKVANVTANTFELAGSSAAGTSATGAWHLTGIYKYQHSIAAASGFDVDTGYFVLGNFIYGTTTGAATDSFVVA